MAKKSSPKKPSPAEMEINLDSDSPEAPAEPLVPPDQQSLVIVGIGASAGGQEAFEKFFAHMPDDSGLVDSDQCGSACPGQPS